MSFAVLRHIRDQFKAPMKNLSQWRKPHIATWTCATWSSWFCCWKGLWGIFVCLCNRWTCSQRNTQETWNILEPTHWNTRLFERRCSFQCHWNLFLLLFAFIYSRGCFWWVSWAELEDMGSYITWSPRRMQCTKWHSPPSGSWSMQLGLPLNKFEVSHYHLERSYSILQCILCLFYVYIMLHLHLWIFARQNICSISSHCFTCHRNCPDHRRLAWDIRR